MSTNRSSRKGPLTLLLTGVLVLVAVVTYLKIVQQGPHSRQAPAAPPESSDQTPPWLRRNIDLAAQVAKYTEAHGGATDLSAQFFGNQQFSAHLHLMAPGQFCPLHHHPDGFELSAIISGTGYVRGDGGEGLETHELSPGDVVVSGNGSRHEIGNRSQEDYLAALVIATPRFEGNLYCREDVAPGAGSSIVLPAAGIPNDFGPVPFAPWADLQRFQAATPTPLGGGGTHVLLVGSGKGALAEQEGGHETELSAPQLLIIRDAPPLVVTPLKGQLLEFYSLRFLPGREDTP